MKKVREIKKKFHLYSLLLGIYPSVYLLAQNLTEIKIIDGARSILFSLFISVFLYLALFFIVKDEYQPALFSSLILLLFFTYGHLYFYLKETPIFGFDLSRIRYMLPLYVLIFVIGVFLIIKFKPGLSKASSIVSVFSIVIMVFPLFQIATHYLKQAQSNTPFSELTLGTPQTNPPDIYYIIMDGYSSAGVLLDHFGVDNYLFLKEINELGFYVAECSQSNYSWTLPSLASSLNLSYLNQNSGSTGIEYSEDEMYSLIDNNLVRSALEEVGYSTVAFENGFNWLHWYDADHYLAAVGDEEGYIRLGLGLNSFELLFLETTAFRILLDSDTFKSNVLNLSEVASNPREIHRSRVEYILSSLPDISNTISSPKFVYAHIVSPHDPYIYDANGKFLSEDPADLEQAYIDQMQYLNTQILEMVSALKENSSGEAVIIIQADHGAPIEWDETEQFSKVGILNAIYLPDFSDEAALYNTISPVNTFRLIFNNYFDASLEMLPDVSIFGGNSPTIELPCNAD